MRIAIFNDYQLPIPAVKGGSVPMLTQFILDENEKNPRFEIDVYSCYDKLAEEKSKSYKHTHFIYSKDASKVRFKTNLLFTLKNKLKIPFDLSKIPMPKSAKKYFQAQSYDAVYINGYIRGALAIMDAQKSGKTIIHHHVVTDLLGEKTIRGEELIRRADKLCFVSSFAETFTQGLNEDEQKKFITLPNAIDVERFATKSEEDVLAIRAQYAIKPTDKVVLFVGRMVPDKGAYELIKGFIDANLGDDVKLLIVGGATYSSKKVTPYVQTCLDLAKNSPNIIFTGYVPYSQLERYYHIADVSTLLSRCNEACGLVGIESIASGLPLITTDRGGIGEYVIDGCKVVVPDDENMVENVSKALRLLVENDELRVQLGENGRQRSRLFDKKAYFENFVKMITSLVEEREE